MSYYTIRRWAAVELIEHRFRTLRPDGPRDEVDLRTIRGFLCLVVVLQCFVAACKVSFSSAPAGPEHRPAEVPEQAVWVGGDDDGVYVQLDEPSKKKAKRSYRARVYYVTGEVWYDGLLELQGPSAAPVEARNAGAFQAWDGETLYLDDGRRLVARPR